MILTIPTLEQLQYALDSTASLRTHTVWVVGRPGSGKTQLLKASRAFDTSACLSATSFYLKYAERSFSVDAATLRRGDDPPDCVSFRKAAIDLLSHQDIGDHTRVPVIRYFRDQSKSFNSGDAFATRVQLLDPGDNEVRNPTIVNTLRRFGLSDQVGTGLGVIFAGSRKLGCMRPIIDNDNAEKTYRLRLPKERLLTEVQTLFPASLGIHLSDHEKAVLAYLTREGQIDIVDVNGLTGRNGPGAIALVQRLTAQVLVEHLREGGHLFTLVGHLRARFQTAISAAPERKALGASDPGSTVPATVQVNENSTVQVTPLAQLSSRHCWKTTFCAMTPRPRMDMKRHRRFIVTFPATGRHSAISIRSIRGSRQRRLSADSCQTRPKRRNWRRFARRHF